MNTIERYGPKMQELEKFVLQLSPEIRNEAFRFLLSREFSGATAEAPRVIAPELAKPSSIDSRPLAPQEFLRKCNGTNLTDKAILLGYWMEKYENKPIFSSLDLKAAFVSAREPTPKNSSDIVANLEKAGKFMRAEKLGGIQQYRLTGSAIDSVEQRLAAAAQ